MTEASTDLDLDRLFKLRLVVARFGEMDVARWWNANGQLGKFGTAALRRGFPRTHRFAAARSVFAVAARRCAELFDPPNSVTLWSLPAEIEDEFDARWERWLDEALNWEPLFQQVEGMTAGDLLAIMKELEIVAPDTVTVCGRLRRGTDRRAVQLPDPFERSSRAIELLAAGFALGEPGAPIVPYARLR